MENISTGKKDFTESRRCFLKTAAITTAALSLPTACCSHETNRFSAPRTEHVQKAFVLWFSQTGNTERMGRLIGSVWEKQGVKVDYAEIRQMQQEDVKGYDLIAVGSPVNHYDAPEYLKTWLNKLPELGETPVIAFVTHGMPPSNQHNTGCAVLEILAKKGGVPVGLGTFGNMGTYPPYWAFYPEKAIASAVYPDRDTYHRARQFSEDVLRKLKQGEGFSFSREWSFGDVKKSLAPIWFSKLITNEHYIDRDKCIGCGTCVEKCPANAIDPLKGTVNKAVCVDCMGCINNCPVQAVKIVYWGKPLIGYHDFLRENRIKILEPQMA